MAADEQQTKNVVAVVRPVEPLGEIGFRIVEIRYDLVRGKRHILVMTALGVEHEVAPDQDEPGGGIARRAGLRPGLERPQARFLERLLGDVEIAKIAQQGAEGLRPSGSQSRVDPGDIGHVAKLPGSNEAIGRISYAPVPLP
jgi:hypothetical protein